MNISKKQTNFIEKYNLKLKEKNINGKIINHIDKNYYTFRCKKHGEFKITSKNIIKRLYSNQTPCPNCIPYDSLGKFKQKYSDILKKNNLEVIKHYKGTLYKFYCHQHKGFFDMDSKLLRTRIKRNTQLCSICNSTNYLEKAKNKIQDKLNKFNIELVSYEGGSYTIKCKKHGLVKGIKLSQIQKRLKNNQTPCPNCVPYNSYDKLIEKYKDILKKYNITDIQHYKGSEYKIYCNKCGNTSIVNWNNIVKCRIDNFVSPCLHCVPLNKMWSIGEQKLLNFIKNVYNGEVISSDRKILGNGKEIDIYLPELKIGIEYNGLYWHSDNKDRIYKEYHKEKTDIAKDKGITLYHFFEDELKQAMYFIYNKLPIKKNIDIEALNKTYNLNLRLPTKIGARKLEIKDISKQEAKIFLDTYHIQGKDNAKLYIGAYYDNNLVAVMSFKQQDKTKNIKFKKGEWELSRYAIEVGYMLIGGFKKMLSYFIKNNDVNKIYSYSDLRISNPENNVYIRSGFKYVKFSGIDYYYIYKNKRHHRFSFRKHKLYELCKNYNIYTEEYKKETEDSLYFKLKENINISRIYGCGRIKWELDI